MTIINDPVTRTDELHNAFLRKEMERLALAMLTDEDIIKRLKLTPKKFQKYYHVVERARLLLKQQLNEQKLANSDRSTIAELDQLIAKIPECDFKFRVPSNKSNNPAGKPVGSTGRITAGILLQSIEKYSEGIPFTDLLADGYIQSIKKQDTQLRLAYERMFLNKVIADKHAVDVTSHEQVLENIVNKLEEEYDHARTIDMNASPQLPAANIEPTLEQLVEQDKATKL